MLNIKSLSRTHLRALPAISLSMFLALVPLMAHARNQAAVDLPPVKPAEARGAIVISGSPTMYALTVKVGEQFKTDGFGGNLSITSTNTTKGVESFCKGEIDIVDAVRAMTPEEITTCKVSGREPIQLKVGVDAVVIAVSRSNRFVDGLTKDQASQIFSGKARTWKEINPKWPAETIALISPVPALSTYSYLSEQLFADTITNTKEREAIIAAVPGVKLMDDFGQIAKSVNKSNFAVGYFGYSFYAANRARLRAVPYEAVLANDKTVPANQYALSRPLILVTSAKLLKEKPQVAMFVNYYLTNVSKLAPTVGYFPEPEKLLSDAKTAYLKALQ
jgi:phosphate transport system substrate-binding protein